jgi:hypothetical protein
MPFESSPDKAVEKQDTRFKPGQSGNPSGRARGARNKVSEGLCAGVGRALSRRRWRKNSVTCDRLTLRFWIGRNHEQKAELAARAPIYQDAGAALCHWRSSLIAKKVPEISFTVHGGAACGHHRRRCVRLARSMFLEDSIWREVLHMGERPRGLR